MATTAPPCTPTRGPTRSPPSSSTPRACSPTPRCSTPICSTSRRTTGHECSGDLGAHQALRRRPGPRRARPHRRTRPGRRIPRPQRRGEVDHGADPARPAARGRRARRPARRRPVDRRGHAAPPAGVRARRGDAVAEPDRRRGDRPAGPAPRASRRPAQAGTAGAVRARPDQEDAHLLQGQPAEGRARRGAGCRRRAAAARRADVRAGPAHGGGVHRMHRRGEGRRPLGAAVEPHPRRGREALRHRDDHPERAHGGERHAAAAAAPDPKHGHRRHAVRPGAAGPADRRARLRRRRAPGDVPGGQRAPRRGHRPARGARPGEPGLRAAVPGAAVPPALRRRARRARVGGHAMSAVAVAPGSTAYAGTGTLLRAAVRRDRRRLLIWVLSLGALSVYTAIGLGAVYTTAAARQSRAAVMQTPAGIILGGPGYGTENYTLGAMIANELGLSIMVAMAVMSLLLVVRHTRAEEDDGRADLLLSGTVGRRAPLLAALLLMGAANLAVAVVVFAGLVGSGLAAVDSLALAVGWALTGAVFGCVGAVTAQAMGQARAASGTALAVLGAAAVVRGVGDILTEHGSALSWLSPIAWAQQTRAFVDLRWWPLLLSVVLVAALAAVAFALDDRRDVGAGLVAPRRGPEAAAPSLGSPAALAARLQRGTVVGWAAALLLLGLTFGSLAKSVTSMVGDIPQLRDALAAGDDPIDSFAAAAAMYFGLLAASYAVAAVLRLRGEEGAGRVELLLTTALDRRRLLGATLAVTAGAATLLLVIGGLADGLAAAATLGDAGRMGPQLGAALAQLPAVLLVIGLAAALVGLLPRLASLAWVVVVWSLIAGFFGPLLNLPEWVVKLSPFGWVPRVPAEDLDVVPLVGLLLVAVALITVGLVAFRRRDVPA